MIWQLLLGGAILGGFIGILLRKRKACSDNCPLHSSPFLGLVIGALIGVGTSAAITELQSDCVEAAPQAESFVDAQNKSTIASVNTSNFSNAIKQDAIVIIDFWAEWCGPCKMMEPVLEKFAANSKEKVKIFKVNIDEEPELARKYGIQGIPAFAFFNDGELIGGLVGYQEEATLHKAVQKVKELDLQKETPQAQAK